MPAHDSESASRTHQRIAQQSAPAVAPPPALPVSATERVLELSLAQAIQFALQNNLDIERGRYDPQVAHTQTEQARAVYDPSVGLAASLSQTKTLPQNKTLEFDPTTGAVIGASITRPFSKDVSVAPSFKQQIVTGATTSCALSTRGTDCHRLPLVRRVGLKTHAMRVGWNRPSHNRCSKISASRSIPPSYGKRKIPRKLLGNNLPDGSRYRLCCAAGILELVFRIEDLGSNARR
jgi:hypothetical protein